MLITHTTALLIRYRYVTLIPLAFIEGPLVAFFAGALAAAGYFNIYVLAILFFIRDIFMDTIYYSIGYYGVQTGFAQRILRKINIQDAHLQAVRALWDEHPARTMFIGKVSYGIASSFIIVAGMVKMQRRKFYAYGSLVAILQFWTLLALGYVYGTALGGTIGSILNHVAYAVLGLCFAISLFYGISLLTRRTALNEIR